MPEQFLYLTTTGRRSGLPRRIEIWFVAIDDRYYLVSERRDRSRWVMNIRADPAVTLSIGPRDAPESATAPTAATARVIDAAREPDLARRVRRAMDAKYGWSDGLVVELTPTRRPGAKHR